MTPEPEVMPSSTVRVETPDGTMFVSVCEDSTGKPIRIDITIGKAGTNLAAWASATAKMATLALNNGASLSDILYNLAGISSQRQLRLKPGRAIKSGPDGLARALVVYLMR